MLMKCAFTILEMHEIENRWDPLGQLFTDDNFGSLMQSAQPVLEAIEYSIVSSL